MTWAEGDKAVFEGIETDDGPYPGDTGTIMLLTGAGAWIRFDDGVRAGTLSLVWLDDLEAAQETPETPATARRAEHR